MSLKNAIIHFIFLTLFAAKAAAKAEDQSVLESSHDAISEELVNLADAIDQIFGETRATDQVNRTTIRLSETYDWTGRGPDVNGSEVRVNLRLPILERQGRLVTDKLRFDNQKPKPSSDSTPVLSTEPNGEPDTVQRRVEVKSKWHLRTEPGVRLRSVVSFFEKARATKTFFTGNIAHNFSQELSWDSATLWEESTLIESDYALSDRWLLRFQNQGDWQISDSHFFSYHGPELIQKLSNLSAISYGIKLKSQVQSAKWFADTYSLSVNYRRSIYSNWAFLELTPALLFAREQSFKGMTNLTARLEFLFGAI